MTRAPRTRPVRGPGELLGLVPPLTTGPPHHGTPPALPALQMRGKGGHSASLQRLLAFFQRHQTKKSNNKIQGFIACCAHHVFVCVFAVSCFVQGSAWAVSVTLTNRCSSKQAAWVSMNPRFRTPKPGTQHLRFKSYLCQSAHVSGPARL